MNERQPERMKRTIQSTCRATKAYGAYPDCRYPGCRCTTIPEIAEAVIEAWNAPCVQESEQ